MRAEQTTQIHASPQQPPATKPLEALQRPTVPVREAAAVLGLDRGAAYDAVRRGELPALRIGRKILVLIAPIRALLGMPPLEGEHLERRALRWAFG